MLLPSAARTCSSGCRNPSASGKAPVRGHFVFTTFRRRSDRLCTRPSRVRRVNNGHGNCARMTSARLEYLKICVIDALKDKRWCSGLQREDNTGLNGGERQVGGAHTLTHWRDWSWHGDERPQESYSPPGP